MIAIKHLWYRGHDKDKTGYSNNCLRQSAWVHQVHTWSSPSTVSAPSNVGCVTDPSQHSQNVFSHILHLIKAHSRNLAAPVANSTVYLTSLKLMHWLFFHCGCFFPSWASLLNLELKEFRFTVQTGLCVEKLWLHSFSVLYYVWLASFIMLLAWVQEMEN